MLPQVLTYAWRSIRKSPAFSITAVVTIALGIGASTAVFSVTNAVLLRPLPYGKPDRLVLVCSDLTARSVRDWPFSNADFFDLRNGAKSNFEDLAAVSTGRALWTREDGTPEQIRTGAVTPNFFRLLNAKVTYGRDFSDADAQAQAPAAPAAPGTGALPPPKVPNIAILSNEYWQRRYGGSTAVLGTTTNNGAQIVGVLEPGFELLLPASMNLEQHPDVWFAARLPYDTTARNQVQHQVIGRLRDGATIDAAAAEVETVAAALRRIEPIHDTAGFHIRVEPMQRYLTAEVRPALLALMGASIFLLLIACANVGNLLLVRMAQRERELAVRTALGAGSRHLIQQLFVEALLLSGLGTLLGVGFAWVSLRELLALAPANLPRQDAVTIDPVVLGFAALIGLIAASIFGLAPALRASRPDVIVVLRSSGRTAGLGAGKLLRDSVVIAEVALSFVLLVGSGLMIRSFLALQRVDPGYDAHNLLTFQILGPAGAGDKPEQRAAFMRDVQTRLAALPGVEAASAGSPFPLTGGFSPIRWGTEEALSNPSRFQAVEFQVVLPGYLETMRAPLLTGRTFTDTDNSPTRNVVVVDRMLAQKAFPKESAIGKRILIRIRTPQPEWVEIVGVVEHQRTTSLAEPGREQIYFTDGFLGHGNAFQWGIRTTRDPAQMTTAVRQEIARLNPQLLVDEVQPMEALVLKAQSKTRFSLWLIGALAAIAALMAAVGLYGVMSTIVRQRTAEIGVRIAVGAEPSRILRLVVGQGLLLSTAGIVAGLAAAYSLTRLMTSMLVDVKATDPFTFACIALLFLVIAGISSWLPARRASRLDPVSALRQD